jgi:predicted acetyltransferase
MVDDKIAGFVIIKIENSFFYLRHFFVLRKFRRHKVGFEAAKKVFHLFNGKWRISTMDYNTPCYSVLELCMQ